jgi:CRP-like cAMP-binding protein
VIDAQDHTPYGGGNRLIDGLPAPDRDAIVRELAVMTADEASGGISHGERITAAYFPIDAVFSVLVELSGGDCYEVDTVGRGGLIGGELLLGLDAASRSVICQIEGRFARMPADAFARYVAEAPAFAVAVHRALLLQWYRAQQTIACNFAHSLVERCARWTLLTREAVGRLDFRFRAEYLAMMLGEPTHAVVEPMAALQAIGALRYGDDSVTIVSERRLREAACECYTAPVDFAKRLTARDGAQRKMP